MMLLKICTLLPEIKEITPSILRLTINKVILPL